MVEATEKFLVDSNSFMTPFRFYYAFDLIPSYWKELSNPLISKYLVVLDMVKDEIDTGQDDLSRWLDGIENLQICPHVTPEIITNYQEVLQYIVNCGFYKESALHTWAPGHIADPWLIAAASVHGYTIVTEEVKSGGLSKKTPNKNAKIPDVAAAFGVRTRNLYGMMRQLGIKI